VPLVAPGELPPPTPSQTHVRLRQIKLAGFKSFIDPTPIDVPGSLVGVVGPNGCGKSNVIDAVRWVLGESKAAELRGESMQDVIFNGSVNRKPAGRASVELVFDNSDGGSAVLGAVCRDIREARADTRRRLELLHHNNQNVRRRDVHDMFLWHRPGAARLRDHRAGMISAHRRGAPRGAAHLPRGSGGHLEVQGTSTRNGESPWRTRATT